MIKVWILSIYLICSDKPAIQEVYFLNPTDCETAKSFYSKDLGDKIDHVNCYPGYIVK